MSDRMQEMADLLQKAWENWYYRTDPSGDVDEVERQWLESSDYLDLFEDLED